MEVTVWSLLGGNASGHLLFTLPPTFSIGDLLRLYCIEKGVEIDNDYILRGRGNAMLNPLKSLAEEEIVSGDTIMLTRAEKSERLFRFGSWWIIGGVAFLIGLLGVAYAIYLFLSPSIIPQRYGLVIDAGSTHSQLFVFSWAAYKPLGTGEVKLIHRCFMSGGVAMLRDDLDEVSNYLIPCVREAEEFIPVTSRPRTPLILAATAGMRILKVYDKEGAELILSKLREVIWMQTNFLTRHKDVFIASGVEEGINGWAALNYLLENFKVDDENDPSVSALDIGGASVQVTTEMSRYSEKWPTVNITIFNNTYQIYSKSFLCYGMTEAMLRYEYLLLNNIGGKKSSNEILNPCMPIGSKVSFSKMDFTDPCVYSNNSNGGPFPSRHAHHKASSFIKKYNMEFGGKTLYFNNKFDIGGYKYASSKKDDDFVREKREFKSMEDSNDISDFSLSKNSITNGSNMTFLNHNISLDENNVVSGDKINNLTKLIETGSNEVIPDIHHENFFLPNPKDNLIDGDKFSSVIDLMKPLDANINKHANTTEVVESSTTRKPNDNLRNMKNSNYELDEPTQVFRGSSSVKICRKRVRSLFDFDLCKKTFKLGDCLNKGLMPHYARKLVGFSTIFERILPLLGIYRDNSLSDFKQAVLQTCSMEYTEIDTLHPDLPEVLKRELCFDSMYVYTLLTDGLGITQRRWKKIVFIDKIKENEIVWAMGLMLNRTSYLPVEVLAQSGIGLTPFILLCVLFSSFILTSLMFMGHALKIRREETIYQRVLNKYVERPAAAHSDQPREVA